MRRVLLKYVLTTSLVLSLLESRGNSAHTYISVATHFHEQRIDVEIHSTGGHSGFCIAFLIQNLTSDSIFIHIEPGRRLQSIDTTEQDILIVKEILIRLAPKEKIVAEGYGFCCQSSKSSPKQNSKFTVGYMAPPKWMKLAALINKHDFPVTAVQNAVWVISDGHNPASVYDKDPDRIAPLRNELGIILEIEMPWYSIIYSPDTTRLFSNNPSKVVGKIYYHVKSNSTIQMVLKDKNGSPIKILIPPSHVGPGYYSYALELNVNDWKKEEYYIYILEDFSRLNQKRMFKL